MENGKLNVPSGVEAFDLSKYGANKVLGSLVFFSL